MRKNLLPALIFVIAATAPVFGFSQMDIPADSIKNSLIQDWQRARLYTQEYMNAMPADKYSFRADDSVRTFAQQLLHLAQGNIFLVSTATGEKVAPRPDLEKSSTAQTADSVKYYVNNSYDFVINAIKNLPETSLLQTTTLNFGRPLNATRLSWILKAFEHQTHHRGQTTIYIRLAGIRPPNERLF